jgi:hypothetical protein
MTKDEILGELGHVDKSIKASHRLLKSLNNVKFESNVAIDHFFNVKQIQCRLVARETKLLQMLEGLDK